jgi:hypothetical protein
MFLSHWSKTELILYLKNPPRSTVVCGCIVDTARIILNDLGSVFSLSSSHFSSWRLLQFHCLRLTPPIPLLISCCVRSLCFRSIFPQYLGFLSVPSIRRQVQETYRLFRSKTNDNIKSRTL